MEFKHISVLLDECIQGLDIKPDGIYVDGTTGGAGHSSEIAKRLDLNKGKLFCFDKDPDAIKVATKRLEQYSNVQIIHEDFSDIKHSLNAIGIEKIDGLLLDLGVSSHQLDTAERGFSYLNDAPLDMRMSQEGMTAEELINSIDEQELVKILFEYGEEKYSRSIAKSIVKYRQENRIVTTGQLVDIVRGSVPVKARKEKNPARKTFQALRIAVNLELDVLKKAISDGFNMLNSGGRLVIITFHSLEDRIVKQAFSSFINRCTCPPDFPVCICNREALARYVNKKPILPTDEEISNNKRSRSAKLRIVEKI